MKKESPKLKAEKRGVMGRKVKKLRQQGIIPATLYGKGMESVSIQIKTAEVLKIFEKVGESGLVDLMLDKEKALPVLLRNPQYNVVSDDLMHIDCYKVNLAEKIVASVPIVLVGESSSVREGNILVEVTDEVEVEAKPMDLPEKFEVDLSVLKTVDNVVVVADLKMDSEKVEIKNSPDQVIVKTEEPKEEEIIEETVIPDEVPATEQKEGEEGATEGEGEEKKEGEKEDDEGKKERSEGEEKKEEAKKEA